MTSATSSDYAPQNRVGWMISAADIDQAFRLMRSSWLSASTLTHVDRKYRLSSGPTGKMPGRTTTTCMAHGWRRASRRQVRPSSTLPTTTNCQLLLVGKPSRTAARTSTERSAPMSVRSTCFSVIGWTPLEVFSLLPDSKVVQLPPGLVALGMKDPGAGYDCRQSSSDPSRSPMVRG
jgi:hypothetical protein